MKKVLVVALVLSLGALVWSAYHLFDAAISLDHARQQQAYQRQQLLLMRSMLEHTTMGMNRSDLLRLLAHDLGGDRVVRMVIALRSTASRSFFATTG